MAIFVRDRNFYRTMLAIGVPVVLQSAITIGVNLMDTVMLAKLGEAQISASSLANQITNLFHIFCMGVGSGTAVMTAQYWGRRDLDSLRRVVTIMLRLITVIGLIVMALAIFIPDKLMWLFAPGDADVIREGVRYFTFLAYTYPFYGISLTLTLVLRSVGSVRLPLFTSILVFFINVFFNWIFIFGELGAPRMEIAGAAVGTLIARLAEVVIICGYFFLREKQIGYRVKHLFQPCGAYLASFCKFSLPVVVSDSLLGVGNTALAMIMGRVGSAFVAANAITMVAFRLTNVVIQGVGNASGVITGNTLGMGDTDRAYRQGVTFLAPGAILGTAAGVIIWLISPPLVNFYEITEATRAVAMEQMLAMAILTPFQTMAYITTKGVLRGGGDTRFLMVADIIFLWCASVPLGYAAGLVWGWGAFWIFICLHVDFFLKTFLCTARFFTKKWIKPVH